MEPSNRPPPCTLLQTQNRRLMPVERMYWTVEELSTYTGLATGTLYNWVAQKKMPYTKVKGAVRFHIERTKQWFDAREIKPKKQAA